MQVQAFKALVLMRQREMDGADCHCGVGLAVIVDLDFLQDHKT